MKVNEIMHRKVVTVFREMNLKECSDLLEEHEINGVPVVEEARLVGVITSDDIFKSILPRYPEIFEDEKYLMDFEYIEERIHKVTRMKVGDLMSSPAVSVDEETPICKVGSIMILRRIKQVPIVHGDQLVGIVTLRDICKTLMDRVPA